MKTVKYTAEEAKKLKGDSDLERLKNLTEEEIEQAAQKDPDNPLLTDAELEEFKPTVHKGDGVYAHQKSKSVQQRTSEES